MSKTEISKNVNIFARNKDELTVAKSSEMAKALFSMSENALICIDKDTVGYSSLSDCDPAPPEPVTFSRVLFLFTSLPVSMETIENWKTWVFDNKISEYRMDFLRVGEFSKSYVEGRILRHCRNWDKKKPEKEADPDERWKSIGGLVNLSTSDRSGRDTNNRGLCTKDAPELLTATFGSMGELMMRIHNVGNRFKMALDNVAGPESDKKNDENADGLDIANRQKEIAALLEFPGRHSESPKTEWPVDFPKLLLYGETGVGKTLVSRYLHKQISGDGRPLRISIPEFIGKEDYLEYSLFGYAKGTYTGGLQSGSSGLLVENMGKVVFLDEIEEANNTIQAKLLAFMDDYLVRPRGWRHEPFYCPVLIVAATNCSVVELQKRHFRRDLLNRFTDIETIPPLRERKESMDFIIDCLLQQDRINQKMMIKQIGRYALARLKGYSYEKGNFRELEDVLRNACVAARRDGRDYLCECDIMFD